MVDCVSALWHGGCTPYQPCGRGHAEAVSPVWCKPTGDQLGWDSVESRMLIYNIAMIQGVLPN
jgi:hypothetical protein